MKRTLGLDLGTNSIGWAIVEEENGVKGLVKAGSVIFPEGVARIKGSEVPATEERTRSRAMRRLYMRRRMRKHRLLRTLVANGMCPLSQTGLNDWIKKDQYPLEEGFVSWFRMNPYELRAKGLQERLTNLELGRVFYHMAQRRGFRSNRKGGDGEQESFHEGLESKGIVGYNDTKQLIAEYGTLGKAGAELGKDHTPIRKRYFKRSDLIDEFNIIWDIQQGFNKDLSNKLRIQIGDGKTGDLFFQRPLKGKKSEVGRCTLEPGKRRAPISSIQAELFGVLQTINNIRIDGRVLNSEERAKVLPLFFRRSKSAFEFGDVVKALKLKNTDQSYNYATKDKLPAAKTIAHLADLWSVDAMEIVDAFGSMAPNKADVRKTWEDRFAVIYNAEDWADISERKAKGQDTAGKRDLKEYAITQWGFGEEQLKLLERFDTKQGYHSLSSRALGRIIPLMYGTQEHTPLGYHDAVVLANLPMVFKVVAKDADGKTITHIDDRWAKMTEEERSAVYQGIRGCIAAQRDYTTETILLNGLIRTYRETVGEAGGRVGFWNNDWEKHLRHGLDESLSLQQKREKGEAGLEELYKRVKDTFIHHVESHQKVQFEPLLRMDDRVKNWLLENYDLLPKDVAKLYHHSAINIYKEQTYCLGDPKTPGLKNPMVYRALHTLRMLVNKLIDAKEIDRKTQVNIEMARELDSANKRKAWQRYQAIMRKKNEDAEKAVREYYTSIGNHSNPTDDAIERMWLLDEARQVFGKVLCVYTGKEFGIADLYNGGVEIEHTWPRSKTVDNSMANKMLCTTRYNRDMKKERLPATLPNYEKDAVISGTVLHSIMTTAEPIKKLWEKYDRIVYACKMSAKSAATKEAKDKAIQDRWFNQFFRDYWRTKYEHLTAEEIKPGFRNRQLVATGQISKLARAYMNSYFNRVDCLKPEALSALRKEWLGESLVHAKVRNLQSHHAVDAAVCAAVDRAVFDALAHHYEEHDEKGVAASFDPPWKGFGADMASLRHGALIYHVHKPKLGRISVYQRKVKLKDGRVIDAKVSGDGVRGTLHSATYYGRIARKKLGTEEFELKTVIRKTLDHSSFYPFKEADKTKVVDKRIKELLKDADLEKIKEAGGLEVLVRKGNGYMTQKIKKVRVFEPSVKNPRDIKPHRDTLPGLDHKHHLWVTGGENPILAMYENGKGRFAHHIFSLHELTQYLRGKTGRSMVTDALPREHPKRQGFRLAIRSGKPFVLYVGQLVVLYKDNPEEVDLYNCEEMNKRTYILRKVEDDPRVNLVNVLDARPDKEIEESSKWDINDPLKWLRFSPHGLNAMFDGIDIGISPIHHATLQSR